MTFISRSFIEKSEAPLDEAPPIFIIVFGDKTASKIFLLVLSECEFKGVFELLRDLIFGRKIRTAGMRAYAAHCKVDTYVYEIIFFKFERM